jgi:hypothetical protein
MPGQALCVRIDQQFVMIKSMTLMRQIRSVDSEPVPLAFFHTCKISVPNMPLPFQQGDALFLDTSFIKQAKRDGCSST